jgi:hypothetical protein
MMDPRETLELAARHCNILECLSTDFIDYPVFKRKTGEPPSSVDRYVTALKEARLVELAPSRKPGSKNQVIRISELGISTLNFIKKYEKFVATPSIDASTLAQITKKLSYLQDPKVTNELKEKYFKGLLEMCRKKPEILLSKEFQNCLERYINGTTINHHIDNLFNYFIIENSMQNCRAKEWFINNIYPPIKEQFKNKSLEDMARKSRLQLLWTIFMRDEGSRKDISKLVISVFEDECNEEESDLCSSIRKSYPSAFENELIEEFNLFADTETTNRFFSCR